MITRYFVRYHGSPAVEVSKAEYVGAERAAGFRNTVGQPDEPATSSFRASFVVGYVRYEDGEHVEVEA